MELFFEQGTEQFMFYEKDVSNKKSRNQKKVQKIEKLKNDMEDPQLKKKRHEIRRGQQKNKLRRQLDGLSQQQARKYLDQKSQKKKQAKQKILSALSSPNSTQIYVDIVFQNKMNEKQNKSLAIQIELIMKAIRHVSNPAAIHLCNVGGVVEKQLQKMYYNYWTLKSHQQSIVQVGKENNRKLIYLSPDAPQPLDSVSQDTAYVIGGLVDRSVIKNLSLYRANQLGILARHLPIRQYMKNRTCLNLDHVVMILCKFKQCGSWKQAFEYGAPKRWQRKQGENCIKQIQIEQQQQYDQQEKKGQSNQIQAQNQNNENEQQKTE